MFQAPGTMLPMSRAARVASATGVKKWPLCHRIQDPTLPVPTPPGNPRFMGCEVVDCIQRKLDSPSFLLAYPIA